MMKLTKSQLKQIIKEELQKELDEQIDIRKKIGDFSDAASKVLRKGMDAIKPKPPGADVLKKKIDDMVSDIINKSMNDPEAAIKALANIHRSKIEPMIRKGLMKGQDVEDFQLLSKELVQDMKDLRKRVANAGSVFDPSEKDAAMAAGRKADIESGLVGPGEMGGTDVLEPGEMYDDPTGLAISSDMSWDARRRAINNAFKMGKIDKAEWRRLRRANSREKANPYRKRRRMKKKAAAGAVGPGLPGGSTRRSPQAPMREGKK